MARVRLVAASDIAVRFISESEDLTTLPEGSYNVSRATAAALGIPGGAGGRLDVAVFGDTRLYQYHTSGGAGMTIWLGRWNGSAWQDWKRLD